MYVILQNEVVKEMLVELWYEIQRVSSFVADQSDSLILTMIAQV